MKYLKIYESYKGKTFQDFVNELIQIHNIDITENSKISCQMKNLVSLDGIEKCTNMKQLHCWNNELTNLNGIEKLKKITGISCGKNKLTNLKELKNLTNINELIFHHNKIESLKDIKNCTKITWLNCTHNNLKNLDGIENLRNLKDLFCEPNPWEYPLPIEYKTRFDIKYETEIIKKFKSYKCQKKFLTLYPERVKDLEPFGFNEKIKDEFADIIEGSEFGFFGLI